jgi:hypothetical protein
MNVRGLWEAGWVQLAILLAAVVAAVAVMYAVPL